MQEESDQFSRTRLLFGQEKMQKLFNARVAIFGIGGVGGYVAEALARSGVGSFLLVDKDVVSLSNINRQIIATHKSVGQPKVQVMKERILDINPAALVETREAFYLPQNSDQFDFSQYSYVVDAVDTVTAKLEIIQQAKKAGVPVISSMGAGNKVDPTKFLVADIYQTSVCPLAKVMRNECKKRGIKDLKVVYSTEPPIKPPAPDLDALGLSNKPGVKKIAPASVSFVPSVAGLVIASEVVRDLTA
jgi:tRNA A37 threonylcarbamoyladenosine dehydratase